MGNCVLLCDVGEYEGLCVFMVEGIYVMVNVKKYLHVCREYTVWSSSSLFLIPFKLVPYVVAVTVMHVLLFVLHVYLLRECKGARVTAMLMWEMGDVWFW